MIALLLVKYNAGLVSMRIVHNQLPIDMLFESNSVEDRESEEYTDCIFRLLGAYPETMVMNIGMQMRQGVVSPTTWSSNLVGKKRKCGQE